METLEKAKSTNGRRGIALVAKNEVEALDRESRCLVYPGSPIPQGQAGGIQTYELEPAKGYYTLFFSGKSGLDVRRGGAQQVEYVDLQSSRSGSIHLLTGDAILRRHGYKGRKKWHLKWGHDAEELSKLPSEKVAAMTGPEKVIVTQHEATEKLLREAFDLGDEVECIEHAEYEDVRGKIVYGNLPLHIAKSAEQIVVPEIDIPREKRGEELDAEALRQYCEGFRDFFVEGVHHWGPEGPSS